MTNLNLKLGHVLGMTMISFVKRKGDKDVSFVTLEGPGTKIKSRFAYSRSSIIDDTEFCVKNKSIC